MSQTQLESRGSFFTANTHIGTILNFHHRAYYLFNSYLSKERLYDMGPYGPARSGWPELTVPRQPEYVPCSRAPAQWFFLQELSENTTYCIQLDHFGAAHTRTEVGVAFWNSIQSYYSARNFFMYIQNIYVQLGRSVAEGRRKWSGRLGATLTCKTFNIYIWHVLTKSAAGLIFLAPCSYSFCCIFGVSSK